MLFPIFMLFISAFYFCIAVLVTITCVMSNMAKTGMNTKRLSPTDLFLELFNMNCIINSNE